MTYSSSHKPRKSLGQNFLQDADVIYHIIQAIAPQAHQHILEIGPGQGALTADLIEAAGRLDAVEFDRDLVARLTKRFQQIEHFHLHQADILNFSLRDVATPKQKIRVVGNLPYNISTPLLFHLCQQLNVIEDMHFMLQKEVVDRLCAQPGDKAYGRLSVMLGLHCESCALFDVPPEAFYPPPKVNSSIVQLIPRQKPLAPIIDDKQLDKIVRQAFSQRRKTLGKSLEKYLRREQFALINLSCKARPEELSIPQFIALANLISELDRTKRLG